eukprot:CAMPEP_0118633438 /NCGR_PEP_ID=MMETSP0785-20121206/998_1 /TAXON_ID=91992 /ORGANISM="Bolidomonas pacifica, Strain CCMP 1866" /LENGTH=50 /DNA_ID=CAMNT_0006524315 /DNA_START=1427 /DNA_END=1579 /DNA_ORIENTATION=-
MNSWDFTSFGVLGWKTVDWLKGPPAKAEEKIWLEFEGGWRVYLCLDFPRV